MTEAAKNRLAAIAVSVAAIALCIALAAQWLPATFHITTGQTPVEAEATQQEYIRLNGASAEELMALPHMTADIAGLILEQRYRCERFVEWNDLLGVAGVTPEMIEEWKNFAILD